MNYKINLLSLLAVIVLLLGACSPKISGTVQLLDAQMKPVTEESPKGTVVNMINTTASLEKASHSAIVDEEGKFESAEDAIIPGTYKVEASKLGYVTETQTVEIGSCTHMELKITLKKIQEGKRKSIEGSKSDEDKIINPGEVNIRPPMM